MIRLCALTSMLLVACGSTSATRIEAHQQGLDRTDEWIVEPNGLVWRRGVGAVFPVWSAWKSHTVTADQVAALDSAIDALGAPSTCTNTRSTISRVTNQGRQTWACETPASPQQGETVPPLTPRQEVFRLLQSL